MGLQQAKLRVSLVALSAAAAAFGSSASAQESSDSAAPGDSEIIVTATKRGTNLQDTPLAVSAIGGEDLERRGIEGVEDLASQVPNLQYGTSGSVTFVSIRGIGTTVDSGVAEPSVATYVDGVFLPRASMSFLRQIDIERVEVLRGPQGTLYGRNATGGAINFISKAPSAEFEGRVIGQLGSRDGWGLSGYVSGPLSDNVLVRLSGGREKQDGYVINLSNGHRDFGQDVTYVRGAVRLLPTETVTVDLSARYERNRGGGGIQQALTPVASPFIPVTARQTTEPNRRFVNADTEAKAHTFIASGVISWEASDAITVKSTTGYIDHKFMQTTDADATDYDFIVSLDQTRPKSKSFSQELTVAIESGPVDALVGAYYFSEDHFLSLPNLFPSGLGATYAPGAIAAQSIDENTKAFALYADVTVALSDSLRLNGGLRFNKEKKDFYWERSTIEPSGAVTGLTSAVNAIDTDHFLPKLGVQLDLSSDVMAYAQWQQGRKSGGHQLSLPSLFAGEKLNAYEVGLKTRARSIGLTFNATGFYYQYENLQITNVLPPATTQIENADADVYGLELEALLEPVSGLVINASGTLLNSKYKDFTSFDQARPSLGTLNLKGVELVRSPDYTFNLGAEYRIPVNGGFASDVVVRGEVYHSDDQVLRYFGTANDSQKAYTTLNASVTFNDLFGAARLKLFADNITNNLHKEQITYVSTMGAYMGLYSEPRTFGVELAVDF